MKVLVTGGAGFIGSHLCEALLRQEHEVIAIDDLSTGSAQNLQTIYNNPDLAPSFQLIVDSILELKELDAVIQDVDLVFHLAAAVGVKLIVTDPIKTISTNIRGTEVVAALANKWRKPLIFTSTSEVYGKNSNASFSESDDMVLGATTHARWSYACSKAIDEFLLLAYHQKNNLPCIVARLFNTVGPKQTSQYGMVLPTFVKQALRGENITVHGDGSQTRTFSHVADVVKGLIGLSMSKSTYGQVFNIGGKEEVSIETLARIVQEKTRSNSSIVKIPYDKAYAPGFEDMQKRVPNISKIQAAIDFQPEFGLHDIIDSVISYFKANPQFL